MVRHPGFLVVPCKEAHLPGKGCQCHEIGNGHEAVDCLRNLPDHPRLHDRSQQRCPHLQPHKPPFAALSQQETDAPQAIQPPAQHGSQGKAANAYCQKHLRPRSADSPEGFQGQTSSGIASVGNGNSADQNHQRRQGTDDDGIQEYLHNAHHSLPGRMCNLRRTMGDAGRAHPRLIGKNTSGTAHPQCPEGRAQQAACHRFGGKRPLKNGKKGRSNPVGTQNQCQHAKTHIPNSRQGHQFFRGSSDSPGSAL